MTFTMEYEVVGEIIAWALLLVGIVLYFMRDKRSVIGAVLIVISGSMFFMQDLLEGKWLAALIWIPVMSLYAPGLRKAYRQLDSNLKL